MTSQHGKQIIAIHILPHISGRKGTQAMKFGQVIVYNIRNIFLEKSYTKCDGETVPRPFSKKRKFSIQFVFIVCRVEVYLKILKLSCRPFAFNSYKVLKNKKRSWTNLPASFSA